MNYDPKDDPPDEPASYTPAEPDGDDPQDDVE